MKNVAAVILVIALFSSTVHARQADTLEYALSFYPIQIGNQWDYYDPGGFEPPPHRLYTKIQVVKDTLIQDQRYHILHRRDWIQTWEHWDQWVPWNEEGIFTYERVDSLTGEVYAWAAHFDQPREVRIDSLLANVTEIQFYAYRMTYRIHSEYQSMIISEMPTYLYNKSIVELMGMTVEVYNYVQDGLIQQGYSLANGIGLSSIHSGGDSSSELVYARINGEEFGERIFTNLDEPGERPLAVRLHPNYPNPFNPSTTLRYDLDQAGLVRLEIYDLTGRRVALLTDGHATAGQHTAVFNAAGLASGFYIARLSTQGAVQHRKMLLVR